MHRVDLAYTLAPGDAAPRDLHHPLLELLEAVHRTGSISAAARELALSYRHVWGELKRWEGELGRPLLVWTKGQPARLSTFGTKLLWAERQAQARLAPQLAALRNELERAFAMAFDDEAEVIAVSASHDEALPLLRDWSARHCKLHLDVQFTGSVDALAALNDGRCLLAGFHVLTENADGLADRAGLPPVAPARLAQAHRLRSAKPGSHGRGRQSARDRSLADLARPGAALRQPRTRHRDASRLRRAACRVRHAGARDHRLRPHRAVAPRRRAERRERQCRRRVRDRGGGAGAADSTSSPSPRSATSSRRCRNTWTSRSSPSCARCWHRPDGRPRCADLPGYLPFRSGEVLSLKDMLPWWHYREPKAPAR